MTREEAIRRIKSWYLDSDDMEVLSVVIPELAESEDEKIRKELLEEIEFIIPHEDETNSEGVILPSYHTRIDRYKSYLEKQKEQTEELSTRLNGVMQEYVKSGKDEEEQEHRLKCYQLFWDALGDSEFFKQKEYANNLSPEQEAYLMSERFKKAEKEKDEFTTRQFLRCLVSFDKFREGEHYWLEYIGGDMYVGRSDNVLGEKFHITPRQLFSFFSNQLEEISEPQQDKQKPEDDKAFEEWIDEWYQGSKEAGGDVVMSETEFKNWSRIIKNMYQQKSAEWSEDWQEEDIQTRFAFYTYKDDPSVLYLSNVFVEETSRNHGFGTKILRAAEKAAETIGATIIRLKVKQNSHANAWYRKNGYRYVTFEDECDWLEKNLEYIKPDKSVEWSEKEMADCMKLTISAIEYYYDAENPFRDKLIHWLKSLRPQPKQEWSDEDKKMLIKVEQIVLKYWNSLSDSFYHKYDAENQDAESCYNWLKSLPLNLKKNN